MAKKELKSAIDTDDAEYIEFTQKLKKPNPKSKVSEILIYLVKVIDPDAPDFDLILGLASFATANKLTNKQMIKAIKIFKYYLKVGVL